MKIFRLNDCEWWMAETLEEAIAGYTEMMGPSDDDYFDEAHEIPESDYDRLKFHGERRNERGQMEEHISTFREEMNRLVALGKTSCYFATTEI